MKKKIKISNGSFFKKEDYSTYVGVQKRCTWKKRYKERPRKEYETVFAAIERFLPAFDENNKKEGICLGTRNNHEREVFRSLFSSDWKIYSNDIWEDSGADFVCDFSKFPRDWQNRWNFIYTNSTDHAIDANDAFNEWLRVSAPGGVLALGFCPINTADNLNEYGCSSFDFGDLDLFFYAPNDNFTLLTKIAEGAQYIYYIIRKK